MPPEQTFRVQRRRVIPRRVERHFDHALHIPVRRLQPRNLHAHPARNRRPHRLRVQPFALNGTGAQNIRRQSAKDGVLPQTESQALHVPDEPSLLPANRRQRLRQPLPVPPKVGPVRPLIDIRIHPLRRFYHQSTHFLRRIMP